MDIARSEIDAQAHFMVAAMRKFRSDPTGDAFNADDQLHFVMALIGPLGNHKRVIRMKNSTLGLHEKKRFSGALMAQFGRVVRIVAADTNDFHVDSNANFT